jgi:hypothetical protein
MSNKPWTELLGERKGNEVVVGNEIIRVTNYFTLDGFAVRRPIYEVVYTAQTQERAESYLKGWIEEK